MVISLIECVRHLYLDLQIGQFRLNHARNFYDFEVLESEIKRAPIDLLRLASTRMPYRLIMSVMPTFGRRYQRVWLVFSLYTVGLEQHKQVDQAWLEQHGRRIDRVEFNRAVVLLYEMRR